MNDLQKYEQADIETCRKGMDENNIYAKTRMAILMLNKNDPNTLHNASDLMEEVAEADPLILHLLFKAAKEKGELGAYYGFYLIWKLGIGANINHAIAHKYLTYAAKHGHTNAECLLGIELGVYNQSSPLRRNDRKAKKYLLRAANKNSAAAHLGLFDFYTDKKAPSVYEKAVNHLLQSITICPDIYALELMSILYKNTYTSDYQAPTDEYEHMDHIVEKDLVQSVMWSYVSFEFGFLTKEQMDQQSTLISEAENIQAKKMAMDWIKAQE